MWKKPLDRERLGQYPFLNVIPGPTGGTFRQVWSRGDVPDPGAQIFGYSTFLVPTVDPFPYGGRCGLPPDPRAVGGAVLDLRRYQVDTVTPDPTGALARYGLAPPVNQQSGG